ncbi:MAG: M15 family metallopeptidase, partial [Pseudohongiellaceae bacterium]
MSIVFRAVVLFTLTLLGSCQLSDPEQASGQMGFVVLIPGSTVQTEVRYFSSENFVGEVIDGYQASVIYLTREAYAALREVLFEAEALGFGVKVFDAYRPQQAVDHFVRWAEDLSDIRMKSQYYPEVEKQHLFRDGYIA